MNDSLTRLESRVNAAVERIHRLDEERHKLEGELERLRERLADDGVAPAGEAPERWAATRQELLQLVRRTLDEARTSAEAR